MKMEGINFDNPVFHAISRVADLLILNVLWLVTSIPIITIGASTTAFYYTAMKTMTEDDGYIVQKFFKSFRLNFKQSTIIWLIMLVLGAIFGTNVYTWVANSGMGIAKAMLAISLAIFVIYSMILIYIFPVQAKFENKIAQNIKNAWIMSVANFPLTVVMLALIAAAGYMSYLQIEFLLLMVVIGCGILGYIQAGIFSYIFKKYIPEDAKKTDDDDTFHIADELEDDDETEPEQVAEQANSDQVESE